MVKHTECPTIIDITNDEDTALTLGSNVVINGIGLDKFYYSYSNDEIETDNASVVYDTRRASDVVA